mgnify:CR=1 FL=1
MSDLKTGAKNAVIALEHLLYTISEGDLTNISAILAQENSVPVHTYCSKGGYWTFAVVKRFLVERGMKCTMASKSGQWFLDAPKFLRENPGVVGFIDDQTLESFKWNGTGWSSPRRQAVQLPTNSLFIVHKMWVPFQKFFNNAFHITTDENEWTRYECHPTSCWRMETVNYEGCKNTIKQQMREYKKSPIMMSNSTEILLCRPSSKGWKMETLLNYECLPIVDTARQISETLSTLLVEHIEKSHETTKGWSVMAHAIFSAFQHLKGRLNTDDMSKLTTEELRVLQEYETSFLEKMKSINSMSSIQHPV